MISWCYKSTSIQEIDKQKEITSQNVVKSDKQNVSWSGNKLICVTKTGNKASEKSILFPNYLIFFIFISFPAILLVKRFCA